ncbi:hypothetical protein Y032_0031g2273 [Ancylostoma ceylanicum]|uniref:SCP domain-containing protein n=1 Tax=Ancylostoma ceylanicum TaxID=53326 RepID=A0A016UQK3_9BILA|nr:hypothetical protein Y032_0031g2273 [Ancylostoma ceylanicum]
MPQPLGQRPQILRPLKQSPPQLNLRDLLGPKYDCAAESFAQQHVTACNANGLPAHTHPNHKANIHVLRTVQTTPEGAIQNMAWWNTIYVGCSVKHCGTYYLTACMYRPGGNHVNQHVYKVGAVCSECPKGQCDGQALCRW